VGSRAPLLLVGPQIHNQNRRPRFSFYLQPNKGNEQTSSRPTTSTSNGSRAKTTSPTLPRAWTKGAVRLLENERRALVQPRNPDLRSNNRRPDSPEKASPRPGTQRTPRKVGNERAGLATETSEGNRRVRRGMHQVQSHVPPRISRFPCNIPSCRRSRERKSQWTLMARTQNGE
jgi:hypothetical protein